MEKFGLYNKLVALPLFVGMSKVDLEAVISKTKFDFRKAEAGDTIVKEGSRSGQLLLLIDGDVIVSTSSDDHGYSVEEITKAPYAIQPECTFGLTQLYTSTITALTPCNLICIDKKETHHLTDKSLIFRLNFLNSLSTAYQKKKQLIWKSVPETLEQRIIRFFVDHCTHPAGHKVFHIKRTRLAAEVNANREQVSDVLHAMDVAGIIQLCRGRIEIPSIEQLINH